MTLCRPASAQRLSQKSTLCCPHFLQASKNYPQLAEHAARMRCQPSSEFGQFLHSIIQKETAANYDNVIATSNWIQEEDQPAQAAKVHNTASLNLLCASHGLMLGATL